ncbi:MAG TPA: alpha/beta fold hydrolase [Kofleriaceae bacterium]|nr:alpha/beta fold hydrolase [Kofleriaceae bacterium]
MDSPRLAGRAAAALVALALAGCTFEIREQHLLFPWPERLPPFAEEIARRNLELEVEAGVTLRGWLLDVPDERFTLVYFYGNGQSVAGAAIELYSLADRLRADVACVDYRGYGFSGGSPSLELLGRDGLRVFDHVASRSGGRPVVAMGYSLGSGAAVLIGASRDTAAVVLVAPPASPGAMVDHMESMLPWYARLFFDLEPGQALRRLDPVPDTAIRRVTEPLLVVHGTADPVVPIAHGRRLFERAASRRKRFCEIAGEDHAMALFAVSRYRDCVTQFLAGVKR